MIKHFPAFDSLCFVILVIYVCDKELISLILLAAKYYETFTSLVNTKETCEGSIPRTSLNIPRLSWENLVRQRRNSQSELNGSTTLTLD
jgi:hypothetical protein